MLTGLIIKSTGFIFSLLPYSLLESVVDLLGFVFVSFHSRRRRLLFSNLKQLNLKVHAIGNTACKYNSDDQAILRILPI